MNQIITTISPTIFGYLINIDYNLKAKKALMRGLFLLVELKLGLNLSIKILLSVSADEVKFQTANFHL